MLRNHLPPLNAYLWRRGFIGRGCEATAFAGHQFSAEAAAGNMHRDEKVEPLKGNEEGASVIYGETTTHQTSGIWWENSLIFGALQST